MHPLLLSPICRKLLMRRDDDLCETMNNLKKSGKKLFLLTNSLYDYTQVVMTHVYGTNWEDLFDVIIVGACKPAFLTDTNLPIYRVNADGSLRNTEGKRLHRPSFVNVCSYLPPVSGQSCGGFVSLRRAGCISSMNCFRKLDAGPMFGCANEFLKKGKIFQGGNWKHLHALLEVSSGSKLLYVGDHM